MKSRAFGGGELLGSKAVRFAHLDEAGTSRQEPFAVVAGVVSHADMQWRALNEYLSDMMDDLVPAGLRKGLVLHAKDLFHGTKKFHRDVWPRDRRMRIMMELAKIPVAFDIPVVTGIIQKGQHSWPGTNKPADVDASHYALAFGMAAVSVEHFMRARAPDEVATLIAEDVPHMRRHAKGGYNVLKDKSRGWDEHILKDYCPLTRIVEQPMFAAKDESSILQVADLLAFTLCRRANGHKDVDPLVSQYLENVVTLPDWFANEVGKEGGRRASDPA